MARYYITQRGVANGVQAVGESPMDVLNKRWSSSMTFTPTKNIKRATHCVTLVGGARESKHYYIASKKKERIVKRSKVSEYSWECPYCGACGTCSDDDIDAMGMTRCDECNEAVYAEEVE